MTHRPDDDLALPPLLRDVARDVRDEARAAARARLDDLVDGALAAADAPAPPRAAPRRAWVVALAATLAVATALAAGVAAWRRPSAPPRPPALAPPPPLREPPPAPRALPAPVSLADAAVAAADAAPVALHRPRPSAPAPAPAPTVASEGASSLFRRANEARRARSHDEAAALYRALLAQHPGAPESQQARVSLGRMLLDRGGDAREAEALFADYLRRDARGIEAETAMAGRARALQRVGRAGDERAAWAALVAAFPDSVHGDEARRRIGELGGE